MAEKSINLSSLARELNAINAHAKKNALGNVSSLKNALKEIENTIPKHVQTKAKKNAFTRLRQTAKQITRDELLRSKNVLKSLKKTQRALKKVSKR
jgi:hypothetical protein